MDETKIGFAFCGSFCTIDKALAEFIKLKNSGYDMFPIMSDIVYNTDTRFGTAKDLIDRVESISGRKVIHTIREAEPIGPKSILDLLIIAPCTGNTLGKLAGGITDTSVTMAAKAHLRNEKPLLLAPSTNDALSASAKNIGMLMNAKNVYFVPFSQDMPDKKHTSAVALFELIPKAVEMALGGVQIQPVIA